MEQLRRRGVARAAQPAAPAGRLPRLLGGPPQRAVGHRHHRVQGPLRREVLPVSRHRLLRRQAGGLARSGSRPTAALADSSLEAACATLAPGEAPAVHSDRGGHYRWPGWIAICEANGLPRSMSRKGTSGDNARAEGFFGLLKQEFFYAADWTGASLEDFMGSWTPGCAGSARAAYPRRSAGSRPTSTGLARLCGVGTRIVRSPEIARLQRRGISSTVF